MNKKIIILIYCLLIAASTIFTACNTGGGRGVVINGVRWAAHNVDTSGTFTRNIEDAGGLFAFDEAQNACPRGWRLPTYEELRSLVDAVGGEWTAQNGVNGRTFGTTPNQIFLPASGFRNTLGALSSVGFHGLYWSSSPDDINYAWFMQFGSGNTWIGINYRANAFSVRCVQEL